MTRFIKDIKKIDGCYKNENVKTKMIIQFGGGADLTK